MMTDTPEMTDLAERIVVLRQLATRSTLAMLSWAEFMAHRLHWKDADDLAKQLREQWIRAGGALDLTTRHRILSIADALATEMRAPAER